MDKTQALTETYAKSLADVAVEKNAAAAVYDDVKAILSVLDDKKVQNFLASTAVSLSEKACLVRLFQESGSDYMKNFLEIILQNERQSLLKPIMEEVLKSSTSKLRPLILR